jgi:hypothetical protein
MKIKFVLFYMLVPFWVFAVNWKQEYCNEREMLRQDEILAILDQGNRLLVKTDLVRSLMEGGSAFFPHTYIRECGDQIAAVAEASLLAAEKSGKNQILVLGVLHPMTEMLQAARSKERQGLDLTNEPLRGVFGPDLTGAEVLSGEFSVDHFLFLLDQIVKIRGTSMPCVIVRYPNLVQGNADSLPGIEGLKKLAAESIVVATSDLCHHGAPYRTPIESRFVIGESALSFARESVEKCLVFLNSADLPAYRISAYEVKSDSVCVGQVMNTLLGPLEGEIKDLKLVDLEFMFPEHPGPIWVAATLVELKPRR